MILKNNVIYVVERLPGTETGYIVGLEAIDVTYPGHPTQRWDISVPKDTINSSRLAISCGPGNMK
jgi:hypothetical protein